MKGSKVYDQYWVNGTCKTKIRKAIYAQMLVKRLQTMEVKELSAMQDAFTGVFEEICDRQQNPKEDDAKAYAEMCAGLVVEAKLPEPEAAKEVVAAPVEEKKQEIEVTRTAVDATGWSEEEVALLQKACLKFPPGTGQRWKTIAQYCCKP